MLRQNKTRVLKCFQRNPSCLSAWETQVICWWSTLHPQTPIITMLPNQRSDSLLSFTPFSSVETFQRSSWRNVPLSLNHHKRVFFHIPQYISVQTWRPCVLQKYFLEIALDAERFSRLALLWTTAKWSHLLSFPALWAACPLCGVAAGPLKCWW